MNGLPEGWKWLSLSEIGVSSNESIIPAKYENELFEVWSVPNYEKDEPEYLKGKEIGSNKIVVQEGDVLLCKINPRINRVWQVRRSKGLKQIASTEWVVVRNKEVNASFLVYQLQSQRIRNELLKDVSGVGGSLMRARPNAVKNLKLTLPHRELQDQIVSKIEELFSELDKGIEELKTAQQQLKVYRQAVLKWAFEGKLTNENVKDGELPEGWKLVSVGSICKCIVPNRDKPKSFTGDIKWVTTPNLSDNSIKLDYPNINLGLSKEEVQQFNARVIPTGSVIMTCVGTFGLSAIVEQPIVANQQLHAFITNDLIDPRFLAYCIQYNKPYFESKSTSTTIQYLNKENCNSMPLPLCTIEEQQQIVQEIESRLSVCDKIEEAITASLKQAEALRQSILKKAFEGKLTF